MGCCCSKKADAVHIPPIVRAPAQGKVTETELPPSVVVTGGRKLHENGLDGTGVRVAVIDSGIDEKHPGFKGKVTRKVWYRWGTPLSEDDHGTHVAGTIHLMAPGADIYDYRVFGRTGHLPVDEAVGRAIRAAADANCQVINMSLGGPASSASIKEAVQYAAKKGVLMVCAAGNEGDNDPLTNEISYPAYYDECIGIAAVSMKKGFPVAVFSNSNAQVDYCGIGVDVVSFKPGNGFQNMSGTSMAAPHVAGLVACLMTNGRIKNDGEKTDDTLRKLLNESHAIDIGTEGTDNATGVGFLTYLEEADFDLLLPRKAGKLSAAKVH